MAVEEILTINDNGEVEITNEGLSLIPVAKVLQSLNYNKQKGDIEGRKRERMKAELKYVWLVHHPKSPYREYSDKEKDIEARVDCGFLPEWNPSTELSEFIVKYRGMIYTRVMRLLDSAEGSIDKIRAYLDSVDFNERTATGGVVNHPIDVMKLISELPKVVSGLKELQQQARTNMTMNKSKSRGDHDIGWIMEEKQEDRL